MSAIEFQGGPQNGQRALYEDQGAPTGAPDESADAAGGGDGDEDAMFSSILSAARSLLDGGTLSEQNKLLMEQATTLIQKIKASEEKEMNDAMSGKMSPGILRKAGSQGGGGY